MSNLVSDVLNQSLDAAGIEFTIGDAEEGTREAQVCLRAYGQCRRQLLRAAHWDFARKQGSLLMIADATGQTATVGTQVPIPWTYEYAYPIDALKLRFVPRNNELPNNGAPPGNIAIPATPLMTGLTTAPQSGIRIHPARFTIGIDTNNLAPLPPGWWDTQGIAPNARAVVLTNVCQAQAIYTADMIYPNMWDAQFRAALVAYIASEIALPLSKDKKFGLTLRGQQIMIAKDKIGAARISDGNEGWFSTDHTPDWMRSRTGGSRWNSWGPQGGPGMMWCGWDSAAFSDGSAY